MFVYIQWFVLSWLLRIREIMKGFYHSYKLVFLAINFNDFEYAWICLNVFKTLINKKIYFI